MEVFDGIFRMLVGALLIWRVVRHPVDRIIDIALIVVSLVMIGMGLLTLAK